MRGRIKAGEAYVGLGVRNNLKAGLNKASAQLKKFGAGLSQLGTPILAAGAGIASGFGTAASIFANFDDQMRAVRAVTQASGADFIMLTNTAKELGRTTSFTAGEVAGLMIELGRAGFDPTQINAMTGAVLNLSKATGTEAATSAGIVAASIRQFGLQAEDGARVADLLTVAANGSFNSVESLGEAMKFAGPVAADLGMSMEETLAILGGLGNIGVQGSAAGSALRRLTTLSAAEADKLEKIFGVSFKDSAGNARPLVEALGDVNEATKNLSSTDRATKFNKAFGLLGITAASAIGKSVGAIGELSDKLNNAEGAASKAAAEMESGIGGSFRKLLSAAEGIAIAVGNAVAGPLSQFAGWLSIVSGTITSLAEKNQGLIRGVLFFTGGLIAAGAALTATGLLFSVAATAVGGLVTVMGAAASLIGVIGSVIAAVVSPIGLIVGGITAATVAFFTFTETGRNVVDWFVSNFSKVFDSVTSVVGSISDALQAGDMALAAEIGFTAVKLAIGTILDEIERLFGASFESMFQVVAQLGKSIAQVVGKLNQARQGAVNFLSEGIGSLFLSAEAQKVLREDNQRASERAGKFTEAINNFDADQFGSDINDALDVESLSAKLEQLKRQAKEAKEARESVQSPEGPQAADPFSVELGAAKLQQAAKASFANFVGLSARASQRSGPGARKIEDKILAENEKQTDLLEKMLKKKGGLKFS